MLNLSKLLSILSWHIGLLSLIRPALVKAQSATILAEAGCSSIFFGKGLHMTYQWVCDDVPTIAFADFVVDGRYDYEIDVLSGFPDDTQSKKTHPEYRTKYKWSDSDLISIGRDNCLYANMKLPGDYYIKNALGDQIGQCPPSKLSNEGENTLFLNPYYMREKYRREANLGMTTNADPQQQLNSKTTNSDFVADNAGVPNIPDVVGSPIGFAAPGSPPRPADEVAFDHMDFSSADFPSFDR